MSPPINDLPRKIHACWLGKNIGGTLGGPHEGKPGPLALSFYDPVPDGVLPNDDLDLQLVWLHHLLKTGATQVTPEILGEAWTRHVTFPYDEYAISLRNAACGLSGPARGATDNFFGECMGAAIRSEIWACVAPGNPARAAGFAWADAVNDHSGEGVWAEVFFAALQSLAFVETGTQTLLADALARLPEASEIRRAVLATVAEWDRTRDWPGVREYIIARYARTNFTHVTANVCFTILGWLAGGGDFWKSICIAVNCGYDTDCTGATLGALLGIINPEGIDNRWLAPIGEGVVVSAPIIGIEPPATLAELTSQVMELGCQLRAASPVIGEIAECRPATRDTAFFHQPVLIEHRHDYTMGFEKTPPPDKCDKTTIHGQWLRFQRESFMNKALDIVIPFYLPAPGDYAVMAWSDGDITCALDDQPVLAVPADDTRRNIYAAPSPHRAGPFRAEVRIGTGAHTLRLRLRRPQTATDCVFALADAATHQWLPGAFGAQGRVEGAPLRARTP
ncbi:ADP-ribosylglycohydrolase family protein [Termitidicoccus mucosus]|uniref:ADP-ribosylglycohydrolase n=1 Tax=Termitidicoccus mucosus TaxID=1184151 RepID=A0A178IMX5_9BACT|nr:hypothetical protein AW736_04255 [Opitutaceae bacterium TSB47]